MLRAVNEKMLRAINSKTLKAGNYPHVTPAQAGVYGYQPALVRQ
jgi:hypothetical protein